MGSVKMMMVMMVTRETGRKKKESKHCTMTTCKNIRVGDDDDEKDDNCGYSVKGR